MTDHPSTIAELLAGDAGDIALETPERPPLTYGGLAEQVESAGAALGGLGVGRSDRVAIVLAGGPDAATAFVSVAAYASAAPLNPAYRREEFEFYLSDLQPRLVLSTPDAGDAIHAAAAGLDVPVAHVQPAPGAAGAFGIQLASGPARRAKTAHRAEASDTALLLHTSGTTARPKLVPLTHANISAGARNVASTLGLGPRDRCLAVMPLFHIHGLVASVLATLSAGGTVVATPGFNAFKFFEWVESARPTWVTAVPAMYQAILGRASRHPDTLRSNTLRFMRSSSSALPPSLMRKVEETFGIPLVEAMGMTESSHQVASNRLPPSERRAGSVGLAAGPEVAVLRDGAVQRGADGELVIRGPNVMSGYERNDEANAAAFVDGWFRTGDLGSIDASGFVTITGRIKEMINRGGEKVGPREVEEVLLDHVDVEQAVVFPAPHRNLGEEVAAAVVLAPDSDVGADQLRAFARERLAAFKVPRRLLIVDDIPKGPTGKPQRLMLARQLGLTDDG